MDPKYTPAYLLRAYAWQVLKANLSWDEANYGGVIPIVPVSEEPELTQYDKPFIVYGYVDDPTVTDAYFRRRGSMTFVIYSTNFGEIATAMNVLNETFGREDDSARDVNAFTSTIPQFRGIRFGNINVGFAEGAAPEETEGGRQSALLNIRYDYFVDYAVKQFNAKTGQWA